jgi:tetratricopeptide (TPR) repeat protein
MRNKRLCEVKIMVKKHHRESGKGLISALIQIIILAAIGGAAFVYYPKYKENRDHMERARSCAALYHSKKWEETITAYEKLWSDFPNRQKTSLEIQSVRTSHEVLAEQIYGKCLSSPAATAPWGQCAKRYEKAASYGPLQTPHLLNLAECYMALKQLDKAKTSIAEAAQRGDANTTTLTLLQKRLQKGGP